MKIVTDLHLHSKYSRATSQQMVPEELERWAFLKGINIIGTGDCSHPGWVSELKQKLIETDCPGLYQLNPQYSNLLEGQWQKSKGPYFLISGELSTIYKHAHRVRKVHTLFLVPNFTVLNKINTQLSQIGNIAYDGRPILGISTCELAKIFWDADPNCEAIPAHIWTPWFSLFGSKSGYDAVAECFNEEESKIYSLETGLSSDPDMNWQVSSLDKYTLISNSDAHSLINLGREATLFDLEKISYLEIIRALRKENKGFIGTIEFFPEEGKYHNDGHRACKVNLSPHQARLLKNICPSCGKPLTLGVLHRVESLADRKNGEYINPNHKVYYAIPLLELIAETRGLSKNSKIVKEQYLFYINKMPELEILLFGDSTKLNFLFPELIEAILKMRRREVFRIAGFDGEYGKINVNNRNNVAQGKLF